jgi:hypothetical protein
LLEGEVGGAAVLGAPVAVIFVVGDDHLPVIPVAKTHVEVETNVSGVLRAALEVNGESARTHMDNLDMCTSFNSIDLFPI